MPTYTMCTQLNACAEWY